MISIEGSNIKSNQFENNGTDMQVEKVPMFTG